MFGIEPVYEIALIGALYSLASTFVMNKLVDRKKVQEMQEETKQLQKELSEASKSGDVKKIEEVNRRYEQFMPKMLKTQLEQMKPLIVLLPALAILTPLLKGAYATFVIKLPFYLPIFIQHFENFPNWRDTFGAVGWFWICVLAFGLGAYLIKSGYDKLGIKLGLAEKLKNAFGNVLQKKDEVAKVESNENKNEITAAKNGDNTGENKKQDNIEIGK